MFRPARPNPYDFSKNFLLSAAASPFSPYQLMQGRKAGGGKEKRKKKFSKSAATAPKAAYQLVKRPKEAAKPPRRTEQQARPTDLTFTTLTGKEVHGQHERKKFMMPETISKKSPKLSENGIDKNRRLDYTWSVDFHRKIQSMYKPSNPRGSDTDGPGRCSNRHEQDGKDVGKFISIPMIDSISLSESAAKSCVRGRQEGAEKDDCYQEKLRSPECATHTIRWK